MINGKFLILLALLILIPALPIRAQTQDSDTRPQPSAPAEAGGPAGDLGPLVIPKKTESLPEPEIKPPKNPEGIDTLTITKNVQVVNVDVLVTTKDGQFIPNLKKENFKIFEDGVQQQITNFSQSEAPITAVMLVEFAATNYYFMSDALNASYAFAQTLKKDDWVALVSFDMKPYILVDFTRDKRALYGGLSQLRIPGFSETNVFDALYDTIDRLEGIEGRKYIILISTGRDTFSKLTYDKVLKKIEGSNNITIFSVGIGRAFREWVTARYGTNFDVNLIMLDFFQAENQLSTFARMTGGRAYFPRFESEFPEIFRDIGANIRNQYTLAYHPTNTKLDGTYRKLKVELQASDGGPLTVKDQRGKTVKYAIIAREGYKAKRTVE